MLRKKTYKMKDWLAIEDTAEEIVNGRNIKYIAIGETSDENGNTTYIVVKIFEDILMDIIKVESDYQTLIDTNHEPMITVMYNGVVVPHNPEVTEYIKEIYGAINTIDKNLLYRSFLEMRLNMECIQKLGKATKNLIYQINDAVNGNYTSFFIQSIINQYIEETLNPGIEPLDMMIKDLSYEELLEIVCGILQYKDTGICSSDSINSLLSTYNYPIHAFIQKIEFELLYRTAIGQLRQKW